MNNKRINNKFLKYCPEHYQEIENYELAKADDFKGWICHHRNGEEFSKEWLIKNNMYYNRTDPHEFKFVTTAEQALIHNKGKKHTEQWKDNMKGRKRHLGYKHSKEGKLKMSAAKLGKHWTTINGKRVWYEV